MEFLGKHKTNEVYYFTPETEPLDNLPKENWICLGIANREFDQSLFDVFIKHSVYSGLLEFKGQGKLGEELHDCFEEEIVYLEVIEECPATDVMTSWFNDGTDDFPNAVWSCFYAPVLPEGTDTAKTKVVCVPFDGQDYKKQLSTIIGRLNDGWMPSGG
jgi:hypothetical protein